MVNYRVAKDDAASIGQFLPVINLPVKGHVGNGKVLDVLRRIHISVMRVTTDWTSPFPI